jgi:leucyl/phenylalanyl-tRNA---protein transferase
MFRRREPPLTPDILLRAYACGIFPMAENPEDPALHWYEPKRRGIFPLDGFHIPRSLAKRVKSDVFEVVADRDFPGVINSCAAPAIGRESTWINGTIRDLYGQLFSMGHCHTVETYAAGRLVGGLYGVSLGRAFFGESMFHAATDASKVALVHLVARLKRGGYRILDAQFVTKHLSTFGAIEIDKALYKTLLAQALDSEADETTWTGGMTGAEALAQAA